MPRFCVNDNAQDNGDHEVHDLSSGTFCLPNPANRVDLGFHADCGSAVAAAGAVLGQVNGCMYCAPACHTS
ncbi:hypothetical protein [Pseudactinotalea suaedae]|uniref:hypothetical protein n=1 Tax=Pseudactinotalea suaedae TaxID=1524924 RepID=UPI0012E16680|nr:hypothetical protein [Pseudactinotalea suaedae]